MDIDWSKAPEWATMYGLAGCTEIPVWFNLKQYQHVQGPQAHKVFLFDNGGTYDLHKVAAKGFRPTKQAAPEWYGEWLPPVGLECEVDVHETASWYLTPQFTRCEILAHRGGKAVFWIPAANIVAMSSTAEHFRPIRTKEQRQRDELESMIRYWLKSGDDEEGIADAILSRYNLEPKP